MSTKAIFVYPRKEIAREYVRSGLGMTLSLVPLLLFGPSSVIVYILTGFLCLFAAYGIRTIGRSRMQVILGEDGITVSGLMGKKIKWEALEGVKLAYFSTRRDGEKGWMQLKLKGRGVGLTFESTITEFEMLVQVCMDKARAKSLRFDPATIRNSEMLGIPGFETVADHRQEMSV